MGEVIDVEFNKLPIHWKTLVVMGIISIVFLIVLSVLLYLIFCTDTITLDTTDISNNINLDKYNDLFDKKEEEIPVEKREEIKESIKKIPKTPKASLKSSISSSSIKTLVN